MGRARLRLELLPKEKARRKTYETRKKGLEKKAKELSTLCGVNLCMIMYPPPLKEEQVEPFVWSNNPDQVANLIESHRLSRLGDECSRSRTCDLAWFYKDQTKKIEEEIEKMKGKNREAKYPDWDKRYDSLSLEELRNLAGVLTDKIDAARDFLKERKTQVQITESNSSTNPVSSQENSAGFTMLGMVDGRFVQYPLPYFDVEYNYNYILEYQRRMAACGIGVNPAFNDVNGVINVNPMMSYNDLKTAFEQEPQHIGQGLMITNPADYYFPQMAQHYIGQGFMANNPTDYTFPASDGCFL